MLDELREQLIASYRPRHMPDTRCGLCSAAERPMSMHILEFYHDATIPTPSRFVAMSESRGTRRGSVPVCLSCAPACSKCGLPVPTSWIKKIFDVLQASTPRISLTFGNGYCRHAHPLLFLLSRIKPVRLGNFDRAIADKRGPRSPDGARRQVDGLEVSPRISRKESNTPVRDARLPRHLVPPPGHRLKVTTATADMYTAIEAAHELRDKAAVLITRCFENGLYCDGREWGPKDARAAARRVFQRRIDDQRLDALQIIAEEAVLLGYRAATPLDLSMIMGQSPNDSWKPELRALVARARDYSQGSS
jgi:hypothetical protein